MIDLNLYQYVDFGDPKRVGMIVLALITLAIFMRLLHLPKVWMKITANLVFYLVLMHAVGFTLIGIAAARNG